MKLLEQEILEQTINNLKKQIDKSSIVITDYEPDCFDAAIQIDEIKLSSKSIILDIAC